MVVLQVYKTNIGLFVKNPFSGYYYNQLIQTIKINGVGNLQVIDGFIFLKDTQEITSYEVLSAARTETISFILKDATLANDKIPLRIPVDDVEAYYDDEEERTIWKNYENLRGLYEAETQTVPATWKPEEFEVSVLREFEIDSYNQPIKMELKVLSGSSAGITQTVDLAGVVTYSDIEKMITPEFLLHERPCSLSSEQVYKIVRAHVRENIDGRYARITSDYDFCFTVKRVIHVKPVVNKTEQKKQNGRSYAKPRFKTSTTDSKLVEIFEMTSESSRYQGYTPIKGWESRNLVEMKEQLESYLTSLMEEINMQVDECPTCNGCGHIVGNKINTNERNL